MKVLFAQPPHPRKWGFFLPWRDRVSRVGLALTALALFIVPFGIPQALADTPNSPRRVISMSPSITEIVFALQAGDRLVGVTDYCIYPEEAKLLPKVGGMLNPSIETIISMKPDLIISHSDSDRIQKLVNQMGVRSLKVSFDNLESIYSSIRKIGGALEQPEAVDRLLGELREGVRFYQSQVRKLKAKSVLLILGDSENPMRDLYAVGKGAFLDELLTLAGGQNILGDSLALYPKVSREFIISRSPEVIIVAGPKTNLSQEKLTEWKREWRRYATIRAVKDDNIHFVGDDYILIPGPRFLNIVAKFAKVIHPEIFSGNAVLEGQTEAPP